MSAVELAEGLRGRIADGGGGGVLWVHGYTIDSGFWEPLWALLPEWKHVGVDLPGHGGSRVLRSGVGLREFARTLADAALRLDVRHVVGLSLGSVVALQVALEARDRLSSLTLAAPAVGGGPSDPDAGVLYRRLGALFRDLGPGPWMTSTWTSPPPDLFTYAMRDHELRSRLLTTIGAHRWDELVSGTSVTGFAREPQPLAALAAFDRPVLVLVGAHELPAFVATAELLCATLPSCSVVQLPEAGHLCVLEKPELSARHLARHWEQADSAMTFKAGTYKAGTFKAGTSEPGSSGAGTSEPGTSGAGHPAREGRSHA